MLADHAQRHLLYKTDVHAACSSEPDQICHLIVIAVLEDDRIDLKALEAGRQRRVDTRQHLIQLPNPGQTPELVRVQGIQADVDAFYPGVLQLARQSR